MTNISHFGFALRRYFAFVFQPSLVIVSQLRSCVNFEFVPDICNHLKLGGNDFKLRLVKSSIINVNIYDVHIS